MITLYPLVLVAVTFVGYWKGQYLTHTITVLLGSQISPRGPQALLKDAYSDSQQPQPD